MNFRFVVTALVLPGCVSAVQRVAKLEAAGDFDSIDQLCSERDDRELQLAACDARDRLTAGNLSNAECDGLASALKDYEGPCARDDHYSSAECQSLFGDMSKKFFSCGLENSFFNNLSELVQHRGQSNDVSPLALSMLDLLEKEGLDPLNALWKYLDSGNNRFASVLSETRDGSIVKREPYGAFAMIEWLASRHGTPNVCRQVAERVSRVAKESRRSFLVFFYRSGCKAEGIELAKSQLTSIDESNRFHACAYLGEIADSERVLRLVERVSRTDPHYDIEDREIRRDSTQSLLVAHKVYPVRDACASAASQIAIRIR